MNIGLYLLSGAVPTACAPQNSKGTRVKIRLSEPYILRLPRQIKLSQKYIGENRLAVLLYAYFTYYLKTRGKKLVFLANKNSPFNG